MKGLGIDSLEWNRLSREEKKSLAEKAFPKEEIPAQQVFVCYKCNSIAGHDGDRDSYFCTECGSSMVKVGYDARQWADLSREEKRKACEEAKIRHMVSEIKNADIVEAENVQPAGVVNVVGTVDSVY